MILSHSISPNTPPQIKLCKNCKHFKTDFWAGTKFGKCKLYGNQDLIDGSIIYDYVNIARPYKCQGNYYEDRPSLFESFKSKSNQNLIKNENNNTN